MDGFEINKILGALLMSALIILGIGNFAGILYSTERPETPAYSVEVAEAGHGEGTSAAAPAAIDLGTLFAAADLSKGERTAKGKCASCHTFNKGGPNGTGPNLYGIVGSKVAHLDNFRYSSAMKAKGGNWTFEELNGFLEKPQAYVKGTAMSFGGLNRPNERIDTIAWLNAQSDAPLPLPAPSAAPQQSGEAAPTDGATAGETAEGMAPEGAPPAADASATPETPAPTADPSHGGEH